MEVVEQNVNYYQSVNKVNPVLIFDVLFITDFINLSLIPEDFSCNSYLLDLIMANLTFLKLYHFLIDFLMFWRTVFRRNP